MANIENAIIEEVCVWTAGLQAAKRGVRGAVWHPIYLALHSCMLHRENRKTWSTNTSSPLHGQKCEKLLRAEQRWPSKVILALQRYLLNFLGDQTDIIPLQMNHVMQKSLPNDKPVAL